jgi:HEAT repeat protein
MPLPANLTCVRTIERGDLAARTELILARERSGFDSMVEVLRSGGGKGGEVDDSPLTLGELENGLASSEPSARYASAFLAGRCRTTAAADAALTETLRRLIEDETTPADVAIEAAMSMVLRGEPERGHGRLRRAVADPSPFADGYKAAYFLAQLGDTSGWPAMVRTLGSDVPHYRLMALRHLAGFLPFEGQAAEGGTIDVRARLRAALRDADPMVRQEVPFYLEEAGGPGLRELLAPVAKDDADPSVRTAAQIVLDRLPGKR